MCIRRGREAPPVYCVRPCAVLCGVACGGVGLRLRSSAHGAAWCPPLLCAGEPLGYAWVSDEESSERLRVSLWRSESEEE